MKKSVGGKAQGQESAQRAKSAKEILRAARVTSGAATLKKANADSRPGGQAHHGGQASSSRKAAPPQNGNVGAGEKRSGLRAEKRGTQTARKPKPTGEFGHARSGGLTGASSAVLEWLDSPGSSRRLMDLAHDAIIIRDIASRIVSWNASAAQLYGYSGEEARGKITQSLLRTRFPSTLAEVDEALLRTGYWEGQLEHRCKDGSRVLVESRHSMLRDFHGHPLLIQEINRDITQQQRQLEYLRLLTEVSGAVTEAASTDEALRWILASISMHTHWRAARACRVDVETGKEIKNTAIWFMDDEKRLARFRAAMAAAPRLQHQKRLSERVIENGQPLWIPMIAKDPYFAAVVEAGSAGLYCAYGFAVPFGKDAAIVICLFSNAPQQIDEAFQGAMHGIVGHLSRLAVRLNAEKMHRDLSLSLMRAQDDERRRIARELHDSAGQYLSALALTIDAARSHEGMPSASQRKLQDAQEMIRRCSAELRTLSHLLHPPLLDELGLASAAHWYIDGFGERSGIKVSAEIPAQLPRLDHAAELALFRVLQEALTNVNRHSGSKTVFVKIDCGPIPGQGVTLEVRDEGKGIPRATLDGWLGNKMRSGVGISGMRERVRDMGGTLQIESGETGTTVRVSIPFRAEAARVDGAAMETDAATIARNSGDRSSRGAAGGAGSDGAHASTPTRSAAAP